LRPLFSGFALRAPLSVSQLRYRAGQAILTKPYIATRSITDGHPMTITAIDHVQLAMPAGEESSARRFYGELLGIPEVEKPAPLAARGGCWFEQGAVKIHLGVEADFRPARKAHPALLVDDLADLSKKLEAAGFSVTPDDTLDGVARCFVGDPFGNRIELIQR
jgi:catechol 2,3-dioxygenase-like lactoylglutathione lyase family enzyme